MALRHMSNVIYISTLCVYRQNAPFAARKTDGALFQQKIHNYRSTCIMTMHMWRQVIVHVG